MKIGCVIPAAGLSRRFGEADKLTADVGGMAMIKQVAESVVRSRVAVCFVVVRPGADRLIAALRGLPVSVVENSRADSGMASSISIGISAVGGSVCGAFVLPGDMPRMTSAFLDELIAAFEAEGGAKVVVPIAPNGGQRNPVLWPSAYFSSLEQLTGEVGAKGLLQSLPSEVMMRVEARDASLFADVDTQQDLAQVTGHPR